MAAARTFVQLAAIGLSACFKRHDAWASGRVQLHSRFCKDLTERSAVVSATLNIAATATQAAPAQGAAPTPCQNLTGARSSKVCARGACDALLKVGDEAIRGTKPATQLAPSRVGAHRKETSLVVERALG
jgi:hypothetical protein